MSETPTTDEDEMREFARRLFADDRDRNRGLFTKPTTKENQ